ncbi:hypothetical protein E3N88_04405 [Mikania micrantha]|uniref:ADP-ribosyl cyclase/cyclic ADP-ribose hydrolase n=1 Tax=Mikania micrantha TaxID=192012 RepID=A0A5N6PVN3_9ASTR|nr:hypothetical protein E3N88_04405 [Mikania micrantha]
MGSMQPRGREDNLIGIEFHMDVLNRLLSIQKTEEVHIIGIHGMGGIGKTSIAQALFRRISFKYEGSSFIKNVREQSKKDICALQEKILTDVLGAHLKFMIQDPEYGANIIQERLCNKKVLLVLDDVDDVRQLEFLAASNNWFGTGSRIIITTRDEHLLSNANAKYKPALLRMDQAVELFSRHAFQTSSPPEEYKELSVRAIRYTGRLPLALKVIGCFFHGRKAGVWESALDRLAKIPDNEVFEILKISFDGLHYYEKKILLDIACFFKDSEVKYATRKLDSFDFNPEIGISVLIEKSLIIVSKGEIHMHDLIHEMCLQIVHESFPNSRLRNREEVHELVEKKEVHDVIEAIVVPKDDSLEQKQGRFRSDIFKMMNNLRLLEVNFKFTSYEPSILPKNLRWISWNQYPFSSLPVPNSSKLVGLEMVHANIQHLWKGQKIMPNLKFIHLDILDCLSRFPDVSEAPNIERLILSKCHKIVEVHESVGFLKKLVYMEIFLCKKLKRLPSRIEIESLDTLKLNECSSLKRIPEFSPCVVKLSSLDLHSCSKIQELPSSIRYLSNLCFLNLDDCTNLESIPSSICELKCLKHVSFNSCPKLKILPDQFRSMSNFEKLELGDVESFNQIRNLNGLFFLVELRLANNSKLVHFPSTISYLFNLRKLELDCCDRIRSLPSLPPFLQVLSALNCMSLEKIEDLSEKYKCLTKIRLHGCNKLLEDEQSRSFLDKMLKQSFLKKSAAVDRCLSVCIPGSKIPSWFKEQQHGHQISLKLSPKWQTKILGFAICVVFKKSMEHYLPIFNLKFENSGTLIPKLEANNITASAADENENENVLINYIPFTLFEQMDNDYIDFHREDWSHMAEGNLVIDVPLLSKKVLRCGVHVVYKEDVESIQQIEPSVSSYYWNWNLAQVSANSFWCNTANALPTPLTNYMYSMLESS